MNLIEFLNARLDEDEAIARAAARTDDGHDGRWLPIHFGSGGFDARVDDHIARHDPARALREAEAGRIILARYADTLARMEDDDYPAGVARDQAREYEDFVLPCLAAAWSDHPDYDPDWAP